MEIFFHLARHRRPAVTAEADGEIGVREPAVQFQQRQRVAAGLRDDPVGDPGVERPRHHRRQQLPGLGVGQSVHPHLRQAARDVVVGRLTGGEDQRDRLGVQASRHERQDQLGRLVEPLHVVDQADQRTGGGGLGEQAEHRQAEDQGRRRPALTQPERHVQRVPLRVRQTAEVAEQGCAELLQRRVRDIGFGLHPGATHDLTAGRGPGEMVEQGGLAGAGLAPQHQRPALTSTDVTQQPIEGVPFPLPPPQLETRHRAPNRDCRRSTLNKLSTGRKAPSSPPGDAGVHIGVPNQYPARAAGPPPIGPESNATGGPVPRGRRREQDRPER